MAEKYPLITRTVEFLGFELPWKEFKRYAPHKGSTLSQGVVFVPLDLFEKVCERTRDDYLFAVIPAWSVSPQQRLALVQAHLAEEETRGLIHGTSYGRNVLKALLAQAYPAPKNNGLVQKRKKKNGESHDLETRATGVAPN